MAPDPQGPAPRPEAARTDALANNAPPAPHRAAALDRPWPRRSPPRHQERFQLTESQRQAKTVRDAVIRP